MFAPLKNKIKNTTHFIPVQLINTRTVWYSVFHSLGHHLTIAPYIFLTEALNWWYFFIRLLLVVVISFIKEQIIFFVSLLNEENNFKSFFAHTKSWMFKPCHILKYSPHHTIPKGHFGPRLQAYMWCLEFLKLEREAETSVIRLLSCEPASSLGSEFPFLCSLQLAWFFLNYPIWVHK